MNMIYLAINVWFFKEWTIDLFSNQSFQAQPDQKLHLQPWDSDSFCLGTWGTESDAASSFLSFCDGKGLYLIVNGCMYIYMCVCEMHIYICYIPTIYCQPIIWLNNTSLVWNWLEKGHSGMIPLRTIIPVTSQWGPKRSLFNVATSD